MSEFRPVSEGGRTGDVARESRERSNRTEVQPSSLGASSAYENCRACGQRGFACRCVLTTLSSPSSYNNASGATANMSSSNIGSSSSSNSNSNDNNNTAAAAKLPPPTRSPAVSSVYTPSAPPSATVESDYTPSAPMPRSRAGLIPSTSSPPARSPPIAGQRHRDEHAVYAGGARSADIEVGRSPPQRPPPLLPRQGRGSPPTADDARGTLIRMRVRGGGVDGFAAGDGGVTEEELAAASRLPPPPPVAPGVGGHAGGGGPPRRPLPRSPDKISSSSSSSLPAGYDGRLVERMSDKERALEMANQEVAGAAVRLEEQQAELESLRARDRAMSGCTEPVPPEIMCPISCDIMKDPVICTDGHTYERLSIEKWLIRRASSPMTNQPLSRPVVLIPNHALRSIIESFVKRQGGWDVLMGRNSG